MQRNFSVRLHVVELEKRCLLTSLFADPLGQPFEPPAAQHHMPAIVGQMPKRDHQAEEHTAAPASSPSPVRAEPTGTPAPMPAPVRLPVPPSGPTIHAAVRSTEGAVGRWTITEAHAEKTYSAYGYYLLVNARSYNSSTDKPNDIDTISGSPKTTAYVLPGFDTYGTYSTRPTAKAGTKFTTDALAQAQTLLCGIGWQKWTGQGSSWAITVSDADPAPGEQAVASIRIQDPAIFPKQDPSSNGPFDVQFDPAGSWSVDFPPPGPVNGYNASVTITGNAASNSPGYENVFGYIINLGPGSVDVQVTSSPKLGWDNNYVAQQIASAYSWDGEFMTYNGGPLTATAIPVPPSIPTGQNQAGTGGGLSNAIFATSQEVNATVTP